MILTALLLPGVGPDASVQAAEESLFVARPLTAENSFTTGIEGPAYVALVNICAVHSNVGKPKAHAGKHD